VKEENWDALSFVIVGHLLAKDFDGFFGSSLSLICSPVGVEVYGMAIERCAAIFLRAKTREIERLSSASILHSCGAPQQLSPKPLTQRPLPT
jgi:hypothetical protein